MTIKAPERTKSAQLDLEPVPNRRSRSRWRIAFAVTTVVAIAAGAGIAWWLGLFVAEPAPATLDQTIAELTQDSVTDDTVTAVDVATEDTATSDTLTEDEEIVAAPTDETATSAEVGTSVLAGEWTIVANDATFVGYRADGQTGEAVGRSPGVTGGLSATETQITAVAVTADMTQLTSDSSLRDEHLGDEGIEYNSYPTSTFVLTETIDIAEIPAEGTQVSFSAAGDLTIRETTLPVVVNLEAAIVNGQLIVVGSTDVSLDGYGAAISGTDQATMEFSLVFGK
jgi:YceI-like domain